MVKWIFLVLFIPMLSLAEVQLFDLGNSGLILSGVGTGNADHQTASLSLEYVIEGRFSIGASYNQNLADTTFSDTFFVNTRNPVGFLSDLKQTGFSVFASMEVLEPSKINPLSLSLNLAYGRSSAKQEGLLNTFYYDWDDLANRDTVVELSYVTDVFSVESQKYSMGIQGGYRFFIGPDGTITPLLGYTFHAINSLRGIVSKIDKELYLLHDISASFPLGYMFSPYLGIQFNPSVIVRIGGDKTIEPYGEVKLGLIYRFP